MATKTETVSDTVASQWESINQKLAALAEAMPPDKFDYRPCAEVKTFAEVLRHVAFWNHYVADRARGKKADDAANELPAQQFPGKKQIIPTLTESSQEVTRALREHTPDPSPEVIDMLLSFIGHTSEHYGQLVVYARLNNIVPPASRG